MFILDTNVVSELRNGKRQQSPEVRAWAAAQSVSSLYIAAVTVLELEIGVLLKERADPAHGAVLRTWLDGVRRAFAGRILAFTETTALRCAPLHVPDRKPARDSAIAATALEHGFTVATRNVDDFVGTGAAVIDPWEP